MISYQNLWILLVYKKMSKADLRRAAGISSNTLTRMRKGEEVSIAILSRICEALNCDFGDIISYIPVEKKSVETNSL